MSQLDTREHAHWMIDAKMHGAVQTMVRHLEDGIFLSRLRDLAHERVDLGFDTYGPGIWSGVVDDEDYPRMDILEEMADVIVYYMVGLVNGKDMTRLTPARGAESMPREPLEESHAVE